MKQQRIKMSAQHVKKQQHPDGEIGRHKRLKISRWQQHAGSIPAPGTIYSSVVQPTAAKESAAAEPKVWHFGYSLDIHSTL